MAHYALLSEDSIVTAVIVGVDEESDDIDWEQFYGQQYNCVCKRTSCNTFMGMHNDGGIPFRKNYAGPGFFYDQQRDAFIPPQPFPSWLLNEDTCTWESPTPPPTDYPLYLWNEEAGDWVVLEIPVDPDYDPTTDELMTE